MRGAGQRTSHALTARQASAEGWQTVSDLYKAVATAFGVMGLKPRSAADIVTTLKAKGIELSDVGGFLALSQGSTQFNVAEVLQATFKQHPELFVGHSGEIRYKSDVKDTAAKVKIIREKGLDYWNALPANANSPTAKNVVSPTIASTEMTKAQWLTLTLGEKTAAIAGWGNDAQVNIERIMARR